MEKTLALCHAEGSGGFHLALRNGEQAGAVVLGLVGGVVQGEAQHTRHEWFEFDANIRQAVEEDEQLDEERGAANEFDVECGKPARGEGAVYPHDGEGESQQNGSRHAEEADFDGEERGFEQQRPEAGIADDAIQQGGLLGCGGHKGPILGVRQRGVFRLAECVGDHGGPESPAREDVAHLAAGDDAGERGVHFRREGGVPLGEGNSVGDLPERRAGEFQVRIREGVIFRNRIIEEHAEEPAVCDIRVGVDLLVVGFHNNPGCFAEHVEGGCLAEGADVFAPELIKTRDLRRAFFHHQLLVGDIVGIREQHLLRFVGGDLDAADDAVVKAAAESGDETVPVVGNKNRVASHLAGDGLDHLVFKTGELVAGAVEGIGRVAVCGRGPAKRLGV